MQACSISKPLATDKPAGAEESDLFTIIAAIARQMRRMYARLSSIKVPPPTAQLILENAFHLRSEIKALRETMTASYCRKLAAAGKQTGGETRILGIVSKLIAAHPGKLDSETLSDFLEPGTLGVTLSIFELWSIVPVLKLKLIDEIVQAGSSDQLDSLDCQETIQATIECLKSLDRIALRDLTESVSVVDRLLQTDPSGTYPKLDFESRDAYRQSVQEIAAGSDRTEEDVVNIALKLAREASRREGGRRKSETGYYLIGPGIGQLRKRCGFRPPFQVRIREAVLRFPNTVYIGGIGVVTATLTALFYWALSYHARTPVPKWWLAPLALALSQPAVAIVNLAMNFATKPRRLPRLDFLKGIPADQRAFVVVPSLLLSRSEVRKLLERLEIHYLANRDPNLSFALLTDFPDSSSPTGDELLLDHCIRGIRRLNEKHSAGRRGPFYLFHRHSRWNESEGVWMGRERKRGKLEDFNRLLLGLGDVFEVKLGDLSVLPSIRYVITLDSDTQLPRDTACKLVGTLAHPLNQAVLDPETKAVREGYAILQPRVSISVKSSGRSHLARIFSGLTGIDPYTTAISDVYQDLYGRATFTGKGIYDVRAFHAALNGRFPEDALLSHDLIEGEFARTGLLTDLEVIDDYPRSYASYSKRRHRWIRGDWQILYWLLPRVPNGDGRWRANPLTLSSRWKILDNLRRSLFEPALAFLLLASWMFEPRISLRTTIAVLAIMVLPAYAQVAFVLLRLPPLRFWRGMFHEIKADLARSHRQTLLWVAFLLHQSFLMMDAIVRTLFRLFVTKRRLLEWECMAQSEEGSDWGIGLVSFYLIACPLLVAICAALLPPLRPLSTLSVIVASLWMVSPLIAKLVNIAPSAGDREEPGDAEFLRGVSLRTWRFFADFSRPENHWLVPDNVQENPDKIAHRTSPTNIGLQLGADLAAFDLGHLTADELSARIGNTFDTLDRLDRDHGHLYNWYDTGTLAPLVPRYVSSVDSGNLAAALLTVKQACEGMRKQPIVDAALLDGIRDHCLQLRQALPAFMKSATIMRLIAALLRQLECRPNGLFHWEGVLGEIDSMTRSLSQHVDWACEYLEKRSQSGADELRRWRDALTARVGAAIESLNCLAPWLASPFEADLRVCGCHARFQELMAALSRVPSLGELPDAYDGIQEAISNLLNSRPTLASSFHELMLKLVYEIESARTRYRRLMDGFTRHAQAASSFALGMDFAFMVDRDRGMLSIGYNAETRQVDSACYDLLASEARIAVFFAVAKGDAPCETWFRLGRKQTSFRGTRTLLSWTGTMFEYLMPSLFMRTFDRTMLQESLSAVVKIQQRYAREMGVPWGISESAHSERDKAQNYGYRAFGVPPLRLAPGNTKDPLVVAPYATMLALMVDRRAAVKNLRDMVSRGWMGRYGFYESIDFSVGSPLGPRRPTVVHLFMCHHQAMSMLSLCNALLDNPMQKRFHAEGLVAATELLLQERVPAMTGVEEEPEMSQVSPEPELSFEPV